MTTTAYIFEDLKDVSWFIDLIVYKFFKFLEDYFMSYIRHLTMMCGFILSMLSFNVQAENYCSNIAAHRDAVSKACQISGNNYAQVNVCDYAYDSISRLNLCKNLNPVTGSKPVVWNIGSYCPAGGNGPPTCACKDKHNWNPKAQACQKKGTF